MQQYGNSVAYKIDYPPEYVAHLKERTRVTLSDVLMKYILDNKNVITTVKVSENEFRTGMDDMLYRIEISLGSSQTYTPRIPEMTNYSMMNTRALASCAIEEAKDRVRRSVKRFFRKLRK